MMKHFQEDGPGLDRPPDLSACASVSAATRAPISDFVAESAKLWSEASG